MRTHSIESSVILYRNGTLTLSQAARHAGCSNDEMASAVDAYTRRVGTDADSADADVGGRGLLADAD
ncbi:hypothetical protein ACOZ4L_09445 [Haloplanus ruber]|uniref:Uncharacterized protein n=1 Tax=Haloplanus ruber TaxID=869892 RepID=A0ABD6CXN7_9EURY|nr:hypothetical protein [Haloplanus ruber]